MAASQVRLYPSVPLACLLAVAQGKTNVVEYGHAKTIEVLHHSYHRDERFANGSLFTALGINSSTPTGVAEDRYRR